jgi:nucleotide-binding universal stress UspA family protein
MTYRRMHLPLHTHGSPTSHGTIQYACGLAKAFEASLRITNPQLRVRPPTNWISGKMLTRLANELEQADAATASELLAFAHEQAARTGITVEEETIEDPWPVDPARVAQRGRTSDLNIIGLPRERMEDRWNAEALIFGAGRPCLVHPNDRTLPFSLATVVIAWDASRAAARAVGDALPMLERAKAVHILTVRGEKEIPSATPAASLIDYLAAHNVDAIAREVAVEGRRVGRAILEDANETKADLLVMGAFGHPRLQEFILGGATKEVLDSTSIPLLMAH